MNSLTEFDENTRMVILAIGLLFFIVFVALGILLDRYKFYTLIAGYNRAPEATKEQYDIEGPAHHLGNGLITLGGRLWFVDFDLQPPASSLRSEAKPR